jgi:hypothetical protein
MHPQVVFAQESAAGSRLAREREQLAEKDVRCWLYATKGVFQQ